MLRPSLRQGASHRDIAPCHAPAAAEPRLRILSNATAKEVLILLMSDLYVLTISAFLFRLIISYNAVCVLMNN